MNTHPSPSNASPNPMDTASMLRMMEAASRRLFYYGLIWLAAAVVAFAVSNSVSSAPLQDLLSFFKWVAAIVGVLFLGRWLQNQRVYHWFAYQADVPGTTQDWGTIPSPSLRPASQLFASLDEAVKRGWSLGQASRQQNNQPVPDWVEFQGQRFDYAGQVGLRGLTAGAINENERLFGNLRYVRQVPNLLKPDAPAEPK